MNPEVYEFALYLHFKNPRVSNHAEALRTHVNSWREMWKFCKTLQWHTNGRDSVSNHQPHDCLHNRLFRYRSKKTSKLRVTGLCAWNSTETGEFPAQMASYAENVSIWWRHHESEPSLGYSVISCLRVIYKHDFEKKTRNYWVYGTYQFLYIHAHIQQLN